MRGVTREDKEVEGGGVLERESRGKMEERRGKGETAREAEG